MASLSTADRIALGACLCGGVGLYAVVAGVMIGETVVIVAGLALTAVFALTAAGLLCARKL